MTDLPTRLRASAQEMRYLDPTADSIDWREVNNTSAIRIVRELEEAAQALEAKPLSGYVLVPMEPTPEMVEAGQIGITTSWVRTVYAAMLAAAPSAQVAQEGGGVATDGGKP